MPDKFNDLYERFNWLFTAALFSIGAALVRLFLAPGKKLREGIGTFFGCIIFGILAGALLQDLHISNTVRNTLIALAGGAGKEILQTIIKNIPEVAKEWIRYKLGPPKPPDNNEPGHDSSADHG